MRIMSGAGAKAGVTLAALVAFFGLVVLPVVILKRRRSKRRPASKGTISEALVREEAV